MTRDEAVQRGIAAKAMIYDVARVDDTQLYWVYDLAAMAPDGIAVECGVHYGGSLLCWAEAREGRGEIVAVDSKFRPGFHMHLERYGFHPRLLQVLSWDAPAAIGEQVAFVFLDACHSEPFAQDIAAWPDAIVPGGILAIHDYGTWKSPVVKREVDAWQAVAQWEYLGIVGALIAFRRPE